MQPLSRSSCSRSPGRAAAALPVELQPLSRSSCSRSPVDSGASSLQHDNSNRRKDRTDT
ncbi:hypothetical protein WMY93_034057 [Mugilogobius chulae]|uniref:Uncharacterized protein n=1 Tax=Mugilogobius chulae TaxID=88201 RepID=A0AAW0MQT4_9GOBI